MDKIDEERKQEIADTNERLRKANETITQNKAMINTRIDPVSYTHLDVYKRQGLHRLRRINLDQGLRTRRGYAEELPPRLR